MISTSTVTFKARFDVSHGNFVPMTPHEEPFSTEALKSRLTREDMPIFYSDHPLMYMGTEGRIKWYAQREANRKRSRRDPQRAGIERVYGDIKAREGFENWSLIRMMYEDIRDFWGAPLAPSEMTRLHDVDDGPRWRDELSWDLGTLKAFKNYGTLHITYEEPVE